MITVTQKGDFSKTKKFLEKAKHAIKAGQLDKYGRMGVTALSTATPIDTGLTSNSWYYSVAYSNTGASITFYNTNVQNGVNIAIILQYGHATRNGGYVQGRDYINPAIRPIFDRMANDVWKEVTET